MAGLCSSLISKGMGEKFIGYVVDFGCEILCTQAVIWEGDGGTEGVCG